MTTLFLLIIVLLATFGMPLFLVISGATFLLLWGTGAENYWEVIIKVIDLNTKAELTAIPLFTFAGYMMAESGTPRRLVNLANASFGWMPGGLSIVSLIVCALFTAFTGASGVTIIAIGALLLPALLQEKYSNNFSLGLITATSNVGMLFPPSLPIIVYGIVSGAAIDHMFIAGIIPGGLIMLVIGIYAIIVGYKSDVARHPFKKSEVLKAFKGAIWEMPLPVIVLVGIYGGFIAPMQAAAVTAFYVLIIEVFIYRDIHPTKHLPKLMRKSMVLIGGILIILAAAGGFTDFLITEQIPDKLFTMLKPYIESKLAFLMVINVFLLIVGCMMDIFSAIFVVVPLIIPFAKQYGIDPIHMGIIFLANMGIGYATPPVGMNLFIASFAFKEPMVKLYKAALPFLGLLLISVLMITYIPQLTLYPLELFGVRDMNISTEIENTKPKDDGGGLEEFMEDTPGEKKGADIEGDNEPSLEDFLDEEPPGEETEKGEEELPSIEDMIEEESAKKEKEQPSIEDTLDTEKNKKTDLEKSEKTSEPNKGNEGDAKKQ